MSKQLSEQEKSYIESMARDLSDANVVDGIQSILRRETLLLESTSMDDSEDREIVVHNMALLVAAAARIKDFMDFEEEEIKKQS
jgi:uncharacterized protein YjcR